MNTSGRRAELSPDEAVEYAPISPLAVVALGIAAVSSLVIVGLWVASRQNGKPSYQPALLVAPLAACALGFLAWRQVRKADGTVSGQRLAAVAFAVSGLTVLFYGSYLVAVDLAIRNQSEQFTLQWLDKVATDPIETSFLLCLEPATRQSLDEKDTEGINERFSNELQLYRNNDLLRLIQRAGTNREAKLKSVRDWTIADGGYNVTQVFDFRCPEGRYELVLPTYGRDTPALGGRTWQIMVRKAGLASRETTALGRLIMDLQVESRKHLVDWAQMIAADNIHGAFLETMPLAQRPKFKSLNFTDEEKQFRAGSLIQIDFKPATEEQRKTYGNDLLQPMGINIFPGSIQNPVGAPRLVYAPHSIRLRHHVELRMHDTGLPVVAYIDAEVQGDEFIAEFDRLMNDKDWKKQPIVADRPGLQESDRFPVRGFRIVSVNIRPKERRLPQPQGPGR